MNFQAFCSSGVYCIFFESGRGAGTGSVGFSSLAGGAFSSASTFFSIEGVFGSVIAFGTVGLS